MLSVFRMSRGCDNKFLNRLWSPVRSNCPMHLPHTTNDVDIDWRFTVYRSVSIADSRIISQKVTRLSLQVTIFSDCVGKLLPSSSGAMVQHPHPTNDYDNSCPVSRSAACIILDVFEFQRQNQTKDRCTDLQIITWSKIQKIGVGWLVF